MMERNGILLASKRVLFTIVIGLLCSLSLNADYELTITNNDGTETKECIKSYSFSNNLESIANQNGVIRDIYSTEETLTNKIYMGKPVYRILVNKDITDALWHKHEFPEDITIVSSIVKWDLYNGGHYETQGYYSHVDSAYRKNSVEYISRTGTNDFKSLSLITEYTKDTDSIIDTSTKFQSYFHYIPSSSVTNELINIDLENTGVRFKKGYSYDDTTNSCTKN